MRAEQPDRASSEDAAPPNPVRASLGLDPLSLDDVHVPPVDLSRIMAYINGDLSSVEHFQIAAAIGSFREWIDAYTQLLLEEIRGEENRE